MASLADHTPVIAAWQSLKRWRQKHQWRKIAISLMDRVLSEIALERTQTTAGVFRSQLEVFSRGLLDRFPERQLS
jgi:uncharacterized protein YjiS (DUF1127 family)